MSNQEANNFLFAIATEIKRSFATPVILVTMKDYFKSIHNTLRDMRSVLQGEKPRRLLDIISDFHFEWLAAVDEIEAFKKRCRDIPCDYMSRAIDFSVECANNRYKHFQKYIDHSITSMTNEKAQVMQEDLVIMSDMHDNLVSSLRDKQKCFSTIVDSSEYHYKILDETEELLNWLDTLNDHLAKQFSQVIGLRFPETVLSDLSKTLQEKVAEVAACTELDAKQIAKELESKSKTLSNVAPDTDDAEMSKIIEKIKCLEDRIARLKNEDSSAVIALKHKTLYLEERVMSLENLRNSLLTLKNKSTDEELGGTRIFDHLLPQQQRCRLVEDLVKLWANAMSYNLERKSIISILSVTDMKEVFSDEFGKFTIDKYGRKLYIGDDGLLCQLNQMNKLIPVEDDEKHVYFYDECGRYFFNDRNERIYKANATSSEYCMIPGGLLLKIKENENGKDYWYDNFGRYFLNDKGKRIYCDDDGQTYENDGLGNLVRIRSIEIDYDECPLEPAVSESSKYLQRTVGNALKQCIAQVVLCQPADPINFLAKSLENYRMGVQIRQARLADEQELAAERERRMREAYQAQTAPASLPSSGELELELSFSDPNFINYQSMGTED